MLHTKFYQNRIINEDFKNLGVEMMGGKRNLIEYFPGPMHHSMGPGKYYFQGLNPMYLKSNQDRLTKQKPFERTYVYALCRPITRLEESTMSCDTLAASKQR